MKVANSKQAKFYHGLLKLFVIVSKNINVLQTIKQILFPGKI